MVQHCLESGKKQVQQFLFVWRKKERIDRGGLARSALFHWKVGKISVVPLTSWRVWCCFIDKLVRSMLFVFKVGEFSVPLLVNQALFFWKWGKMNLLPEFSPQWSLFLHRQHEPWSVNILNHGNVWFHHSVSIRSQTKFTLEGVWKRYTKNVWKKMFFYPSLWIVHWSEHFE